LYQVRGKENLARGANKNIAPLTAKDRPYLSVNPALTGTHVAPSSLDRKYR